jgi:site-specific DNA-adenine methylase
MSTARLLKLCEHIADKKIAVDATDIMPCVKTRTDAQRALQTLCANEYLLRLRAGKYVPKGHDDSMQVPGPIFPWVGSKRKMAPVLLSVLIREMKIQKCTKIVSPFMGSGVVEGALRSLRIRVQCSDLNKDLINIHRVLSDTKCRRQMAARFQEEHRRLSQAKSLAKKKFIFKHHLLANTPKRKADPGAAAKFTLALKSVFNSLLTPRANYNHEKFMTINAKRTSERIRDYEGGVGSCHKRNAFEVIKKARKDDLIFLDPPYLLDKTDQNQYAAGDFDLQAHQKLAKSLQGKRFLLCHRWSETIARLYRKQGCRVLIASAIMKMNKKGASRREMMIVGRGGAQKSKRRSQNNRKTKK